MNIEIANRLVQLRKQHNLSQEELAEKLGISRQAVSKWERAESSPDTDNLIRIARLYNISLDDLLKTEDEPEIPPRQDYEKENWEKGQHTKHPLYIFPYPVVTVILFFILIYAFNSYKYAWLVFLTVPIYYGIVTIIIKKKSK